MYIFFLLLFFYELPHVRKQCLIYNLLSTIRSQEPTELLPEEDHGDEDDRRRADGGPKHDAGVAEALGVHGHQVDDLAHGGVAAGGAGETQGLRFGGCNEHEDLVEFVLRITFSFGFALSFSIFILRSGLSYSFVNWFGCAFNISVISLFTSYYPIIYGVIFFYIHIAFIILNSIFISIFLLHFFKFVFSATH